MREIRIAIISKHRALSRFFELEALNFGFIPAVIDKSGFDISKFDVCVTDGSVMSRLPASYQGVVLSVNAERAGANGITLEYPTSLRELQRIYSRIACGDHTANSDRSNEDDGTRIFFYRELPNTVRYKNKNYQLSKYEFKLLERLCVSSGEPVSREELNSLLGASEGNIADVYIFRLRKKLEAYGEKRLIYTVRSQGYKIVTDMEWE